MLNPKIRRNYFFVHYNIEREREKEGYREAGERKQKNPLLTVIEDSSLFVQSTDSTRKEFVAPTKQRVELMT